MNDVQKAAIAAMVANMLTHGESEGYVLTLLRDAAGDDATWATSVVAHHTRLRAWVEGVYKSNEGHICQTHMAYQDCWWDRCTETLKADQAAITARNSWNRL